MDQTDQNEIVIKIILSDFFFLTHWMEALISSLSEFGFCVFVCLFLVFHRGIRKNIYN